MQRFKRLQKFSMLFVWTFPINVLDRARALVRRAIRKFREDAAFPSQGVAAPAWLTGIGWSDQWSFWKDDYPALMITDTAVFRYPHYHRMSDVPGKLGYDRMARVTSGISLVVRDLAQSPLNQFKATP